MSRRRGTSSCACGGSLAFESNQTLGGTAVAIPFEESEHAHADNHGRRNDELGRRCQLLLHGRASGRDRAVRLALPPLRPSRRGVVDLRDDKDDAVVDEEPFSDSGDGHSLEEVDEGGAGSELTTALPDALADGEGRGFEFGEAHLDAVGHEALLAGPVEAGDALLEQFGVLASEAEELLELVPLPDDVLQRRSNTGEILDEGRRRGEGGVVVVVVAQK